jgi:hypothetical protein
VVPLHVTGRPEVDLTRYLLNPHMDPPELRESTEDLRVYTAYDNDYIYIAVEGLGNRTRVGEPAFEGLPWKRGHPSGLRFVQYEADTVHLSFGFRDRVPGHGRQMDDPWAWKGHFYDTDYHYIAPATTDAGDMLVRQWGPDTDRRTAYQTDAIPHGQPVPGARLVITKGRIRLIGARRRAHHPFTAPTAMLRTTCCCRNRNRMITGSSIMAAAALICGHHPS